MNVRDIMSPAVVVRPDSSVGEVARLFVEKQLAGCPVVDERGRVVGIVTQLDLVTKHARVHMPRYLGILGYVFEIDSAHTEEDLRHVLGVTARDVMSQHIVRIAPDADIDDAATLLVDERVDTILVMEGDDLLGVVSHTEIIRLLVVEESSDSVQPGT